MVPFRLLLPGVCLVLTGLAGQDRPQGAGPAEGRRAEEAPASGAEPAAPAEAAAVNPVEAALEDLTARVVGTGRAAAGDATGSPTRASEWAALAKRWGHLHRELERLAGPKLAPGQEVRRAALAARARLGELLLNMDPFAHDPNFWIDAAAVRSHPAPAGDAPIARWSAYGKRLETLPDLYTSARGSLRSAPRESIDQAHAAANELAEVLATRVAKQIESLTVAEAARAALAARCAAAAEATGSFAVWLANEMPARIEPPDPLGAHTWSSLLAAASGTNLSLDEVELELLTFLGASVPSEPDDVPAAPQPRALAAALAPGLAQLAAVVEPLCPAGSEPPHLLAVRVRRADPLRAVSFERDAAGVTLVLHPAPDDASEAAKQRRARAHQPLALLARMAIELYPASVPARALRPADADMPADPLGELGLGLTWAVLLEHLGAFEATDDAPAALPPALRDELRRELVEECARLRAGLVLHARAAGRDLARMVLERRGGFDRWTAEREVLALERDPTRGMAGWIALEWARWLEQAPAPKAALSALWNLAAEVPGLRAGFLDPVQPPDRKGR